MIAYKLLYRDSNDRLWSYLKGLLPRYYGIEYMHNGEWIQPEFGKLFVFSDLFIAASFNHCHKWEVWQVATENAIPNERCCGFYDQYSFREYWKGNVKSEPGFPKTMICDKLKLVAKL